MARNSRSEAIRRKKVRSIVGVLDATQGSHTTKPVSRRAYAYQTAVLNAELVRDYATSEGWTL